MLPLLQYIVDYKSTKIDIDAIILNIQNISLFCISVYSLYCCTNYYFGMHYTYDIVSTSTVQANGLSFDTIANTLYGDKLSIYATQFDNLFFYVKIYAGIDLFAIKSTDTMIHHLCIMGIVLYDWLENVDLLHRFNFSYPLLKTEVSSIFLVLKFWLPVNTHAYNINLVMFYCSFLKFRIIDFYSEIVKNVQIFNVLIENYSKYNYTIYILMVSIYGLYILNIYWFLLINKLLCKQFFKNTAINIERICHYICSYTQQWNIPIAAYIYSYNKQDKNMYDMAGLLLLSICSYMYHRDIYERFVGNSGNWKFLRRPSQDEREPENANTLMTEYIIPDNVNYIYFLNDCVSIHVRSFLSVLTNYYDSPYFYKIITSCGIVQLICMYNAFINVVELLDNKTIKSHFLTTHYIYTFVPIGMNIFVIYLNMETNIAIPYACVNIVILLLFILEPFYKLTHVAFHIMLLAQNYYICLSNSSISRP